MKSVIEGFRASIGSRLNLAEKAAVMDGEGQIVGISAPGSAASMGRAVDSTREFFGPRWAEGDVAVLNDPDRGATHVCQLTAVAPIYQRSSIVGWAALRANAFDLGGWHAGGYSPQAVDRWAEAARFEPAKILLGGKVRREVVDLLSLNSRTPKATRRLALQLAEHALKLAKSESPVEWQASFAAELSRVHSAIALLSGQMAQASAEIAVPEGWTTPGRISVRMSHMADQLRVEVASPSVSPRPLNLCRATSEDVIASAIATCLGLADLQTGALAAALDVQIADGMAAARLPACVGIGRETTGAALFDACSRAAAQLVGRAAAGSAKDWLKAEVIGELDWSTGRLGAKTTAALLATETEVRQ